MRLSMHTYAALVLLCIACGAQHASTLATQHTQLGGATTGTGIPVLLAASTLPQQQFPTINEIHQLPPSQPQPPANAVLDADAQGKAGITAAAGSQSKHASHDNPSAHSTSDRPAADKPSVKPLWPLDGVDLAVLAIIIFSLSLAGGAGIGGGAILVPVFLMLRGWPTAIAVALSNVTILGGSFANFICNVTRHRPDGRRTIDWELILMMEPTTIAGALIGAVANKILPNWITTYLLAVLLTLMALRLYVKGKETYAKETNLLRAAKAAAKERRMLTEQWSLTHSAGASHTAGAGSAVSHGACMSDTTGSSQPLDLRRQSSSNVFNRSFSRLRGSLVVGLEPGSSLTSPSGTSVSAITPGRGALISPVSRYYAPVLTEGAALQPDADGGPCYWAEQQPPEHVIEEYVRNTLFQGDNDGMQPVVALPVSDDDTSPEPTAVLPDIEEGSTLLDQDARDLLQPLLSREDAQGASGSDQVAHGDQRAGSPGTGSPASNDGGTRCTLESPDLILHLGAVEQPPKPPTRQSSLPVPHFLTLLGLSAWVVAADIAQDSFKCGSWQYWATQLSVLIPVVVILAATRHFLLRKYRHDLLPAGTLLPDGELQWTKTTTILYPLLCSSAGLIAGLFGIGGGVVKGPLMLELGVPADVAAATSATMIMFTAASACLVYSRFGQILHDYAVVLLVLGFAITLCSQLLTFLLIKLLGRRSIIVFMMVALMAAATGIMYVQSGLVTSDLVHHPEDLWRFGSVCPASGHHNLLKLIRAAVSSILQ